MATSELAIIEHDSRPSLPAPAFTGAEMSSALHSYQEMQQALDKAMPDQLMTIQGRVFRRKGYWRTVARAFRLRVECLKEERISGADDWGFAVTYRAFTPGGDQADGDGACSASEKAAGNDTLHNVRSHAHTRAYNRAVSNLVGFGEVSAEECERDERPRPAAVRDVTPAPVIAPAPPVNADTITAPQQKRLWAIAAKRAELLDGVSRNEIMRDILERGGLGHTQDIRKADYEHVCDLAQVWEPPVSPTDADAPGAEREVF